jgi:hypothetical protein
LISYHLPFKIFLEMNDNIKKPLILLRSLFGLRVRIPLLILILALLFSVWLGGVLTKIPAKNNIQKVAVFQSHTILDLKVDVDESHLSDSIKLSQKVAPAPTGKRYLVIFTKVENASTSAKQVAYGDYFRLEEEGKKLAPLPLNANFTIPPKSTLEKQLVFIVDKTKNIFNLLVGELDKEPKIINLTF